MLCILVAAVRLVNRRPIHRQPARLQMQFWSTPGPDPATNLAKQPSLDKKKPDAEYKSSMSQTAYAVSALSICSTKIHFTCS
jgi:hypothetical protein